jgi:hypothetical protein
VLLHAMPPAKARTSYFFLEWFHLETLNSDYKYPSHIYSALKELTTVGWTIAKAFPSFHS